MPPPKLAVNFAVQQIDSADFGPMRIVPGRRVLTNHHMPPCFPDEEVDLRESKLFPMEPGTAVVRDLRVWHGGTPNVRAITRFLPNVEVVSEDYAAYIELP